MPSDNVIFRFQADIRELTTKVDIMNKKLQSVGVSSRRASSDMASVGAASARAGDNAISASVKFQTATQGMLNLSTATVQTITSLSNLDRVQNRAKLASIAVARAEDLLANKQERLNQLREKGTASAQKIVNMEREIITATEDLAVKQEKLKIEQAAINDIYALFFTNVANVGISSIQTLVSVMTLLTAKTAVNTATTEAGFLARTKDTIATKFNTIAKWNNAHSLAGNTAQQIIHNKAIGVSVVVTNQATLATRAFQFALGPIGLIIMGVSAAMIAIEASTGAFSKALGFAQQESLDFEEALNEQRKAVEELEGSHSNLADTLEIKVSASVQKNIDQYKKLTAAIRGATTEAIINDAALSTLTGKFKSGSSGQNPPRLPGFNVSNLNRTIIDQALGFQTPANRSGGITGVATPFGARFVSPGVLPFLKFFGLIPDKIPIRGEELGPPKPSEALTFIHSPIFNEFERAFIENRIRNGVPATIAIQQVSDERLKRIAALSTATSLSKQISELDDFESFIRSFGIGGEQFLGPNFDKSLGLHGKGSVKQPELKDEARKSLLPEDVFKRTLIAEQRQRGGPMDPRVLDQGLIVNGVAIGGNLAFRARFFKASNFDVNRPSKSRRELDERIKQIKLIPPRLRQKIRDGTITGNRLTVLLEMAELGNPLDIGNIANSISLDEARRIALLEDQLGLSGFDTNEQRNKSIADVLAVNAKPFLEKARVNDLISSFYRNNITRAPQRSGLFQSNFFGEGFFKSTGATAAFQVDSVPTPAHIVERIAEERARLFSIEGITQQIFAQLFGPPETRKFSKHLLRGPNSLGLGGAIPLSRTQVRLARDNELFGQFDWLRELMRTRTKTGVSIITRDEVWALGNDYSAIHNFVNKVGRPRYEQELDNISNHEENIARYKERLSAMSSGVGGF